MLTGISKFEHCFVLFSIGFTTRLSEFLRLRLLVIGETKSFRGIISFSWDFLDLQLFSGLEFDLRRFLGELISFLGELISFLGELISLDSTNDSSKWLCSWGNCFNGEGLFKLSNRKQLWRDRKSWSTVLKSQIWHWRMWFSTKWLPSSKPWNDLKLQRWHA